MQESHELNIDGPDVPDFLRGLQPTMPSAAIARAIWYQSGYQAGRRKLNLWRGATLSLLLGVAAVVTWQRPPQSETDSHPKDVVLLPTPPKTEPVVQPVSSGSSSYARLRASLLQDGQRGWDDHTAPAGNPYPPPMHRATRETELDIYPLNLRG